jgi:hypothetical protein
MELMDTFLLLIQKIAIKYPELLDFWTLSNSKD